MFDGFPMSMKKTEKKTSNRLSLKRPNPESIFILFLIGVSKVKISEKKSTFKIFDRILGGEKPSNFSPNISREIRTYLKSLNPGFFSKKFTQ